MQQINFTKCSFCRKKREKFYNGNPHEKEKELFSWILWKQVRI